MQQRPSALVITPKLRQQTIKSIEQYSAGSGAVRLLTVFSLLAAHCLTEPQQAHGQRVSTMSTLKVTELVIACAGGISTKQNSAAIELHGLYEYY